MAKSQNIESVLCSCSTHPKHPLSTSPPIRRSNRILNGRTKKSTTYSASRSTGRSIKPLVSPSANSQRDVPPFTVRLNSQDMVVRGSAHLARVFDNLASEPARTSFRVTPDVPTKLDGPEQIKPYIEVLGRMPDVCSVSLSGVSLGVWACYALAECLRHKKKLTFIDCSDIFTGRLTSEIVPSLDALVSAFLELPNLSTIRLSNNAFGPDVQGPLVRLLSSHLPLEHIDLNNTGLGPQTGVAVAKALVSLAEKKTRSDAPELKTIMCDRNRLVKDEERPEVGMEHWARALSANSGLVTVTLKNTGLRGHGMDILITRGLSSLHGLKVLDLEDNTFTSRGRTHAALAEAVGRWPRLEQLNINDSLLGSRGSALLIEALGRAGPGELHTLRMRGNNLGPANTRALAGAFDGLRRLGCVELADNNLPGDDAGYGALKALLAQRSHTEKRECTIDEIDAEPASQVSMSDDGWAD